MEENRVTIDGVTHPLPAPFVVLATQNPVGSAGTQLLPASQMDRFLIRVNIGYPDFQSQVNILRDRHSSNPLAEVAPVLTRAQLLEVIERIACIHVHDTIYEYITSLVEASRMHPMVQLGLSPRGALALCRMTKAHAFLSGREYAIPEDVAAVFPDVGGHRLVLNSKARFNELGGQAITSEILETIRMPVLRELE
jgi:MoxR-like ATPase